MYPIMKQFVYITELVSKCFLDFVISSIPSAHRIRLHKCSGINAPVMYFLRCRIGSELMM